MPLKVPKPITPARLERIALHYLERYSATEATLRRVLQRRTDRACRHHGSDPRSFADAIEAIVARCAGSGLVDDRRFAAAAAARLRRRGASARMIGARLSAKGIDRDLHVSAIAEAGASEADAAMALASRRRIGPFRHSARAENRARDLGILARAGFGYDIANRTIDADPAAFGA